ncbi:hypothetical protein BV22DRAFT_940262 [Leucogyrophana mollusca]|uniref:Uncharacterized protein n=1 Tax=Leucogyrophana mollusca TaxID=85980 RepID=A0ACB8AVH3_9AGAM|nr:hypothetical protein BV22DRAFT_940262 [Leucogyrophana mollusca]
MGASSSTAHTPLCTFFCDILALPIPPNPTPRGPADATYALGRPGRPLRWRCRISITTAARRGRPYTCPRFLPLDLQVATVSAVAPQRSLKSFHHCTLHIYAKKRASCFQNTQALEMGVSPSLTDTFAVLCVHLPHPRSFGSSFLSIQISCIPRGVEHVARLW